jgi:hypothetical protein
MRYDQVRPARQNDANREFEEPRTESRLFLFVLIGLTIIAFLSLHKLG